MSISLDELRWLQKHAKAGTDDGERVLDARDAPKIQDESRPGLLLRLYHSKASGAPHEFYDRLASVIREMEPQLLARMAELASIDVQRAAETQLDNAQRTLRMLKSGEGGNNG